MKAWWLAVLMALWLAGGMPSWAQGQGGTVVAPAPSVVSTAAKADAGQHAYAVEGWLSRLATGLGVAWLASSMGSGEAVAQGLMALVLLVVIAIVVRRVVRRDSIPPGATTPARPPLEAAAVPKAYSPKNVGNDASARPWEADVPVSSGLLAGMTGAAALVPEGFDAAGFLRASKANFVSLQEAWDRSDIPSLRAMMTDNMLDEIRTQLAERERSGAAHNLTEVVMLEAQLLGIEELDAAYLASVEFSGLIREEPSAGPNPFREVWNITRPKQGESGWLVAGVQALQ